MTSALTLPEEVLVLGYEHASRAKVWTGAFDRAAGVACLIELVLRGRLAADPKTLRLAARDSSPTGDAELDLRLTRFSELTLRRLTSHFLFPMVVVPKIAAGSRYEYTQRLLAAGVIHIGEVEQRRWGRSKVRNRPLVEPAVTNPIHTRLAAALAAPERADVRTVMLVCIVASTDGMCGALAGDFPRNGEFDNADLEQQLGHARKLPETFRELIAAGRISDDGSAVVCCKAVEQAVLRIPSEYHWYDWGGGG